MYINIEHTILASSECTAGWHLVQSWYRAAIATVHVQDFFTHLKQALFPIKQQRSIPLPPVPLFFLT